MTKKDFEFIAKCINRTAMPASSRKVLAGEFVAEFGLLYARFNKAKFYKACGVTLHD